MFPGSILCSLIFSIYFLFLFLIEFNIPVVIQRFCESFFSWIVSFLRGRCLSIMLSKVLRKFSEDKSTFPFLSSNISSHFVSLISDSKLSLFRFLKSNILCILAVTFICLFSFKKHKMHKMI